MKTLKQTFITMLAAGAIALTAGAQTTDRTSTDGAGAGTAARGGATTADSAKREGLFRANGKLYLYRNGRAEIVSRDMRFSDDVSVRADGTVVRSDGSIVTLSDDQWITHDGSIAARPADIRIDD